MKNFYTLIIVCLAVNSLFGQFQNIDKKGLIEAEKNRASRGSLDVNVNPNTLNYDLTYVRLELDLDPNQQYVSGTVTSHFKMLQNSNDIYFDLADNLTVSNVKYHGQDLTFQQLNTDEIKINFPSSVLAQVTDSLSITYSGIPDGSANAFVASQTQAGNPVLVTLSEPFGAKEWWPTKQSLNDKIEKLDIKITTPAQYTVGSNGKLMSETILGNGKKLTYWQTNYAIPAYLFALGISNYIKLNSTITTSGSSFPFLNYVYPSSANASVQANLDWTETNMQTFEDHFGLYPYRNEKYGHMQSNWGGGMEHATMSTMGYFAQDLIAHELAHQWFGDKLTCGAWNDIWLNEGFATMGEYVAYEKLLMNPSQFQNYLQTEMDQITSLPGGSVYIPDSQLSFNRIFDGRLSYTKGGYVLRMMKWILGDDAFYTMLKAYQDNSAFAYNYVKTSDFQNFLSSFTGRDFTEFFNDWIYGEGYPTYQIRWTQNASNNKLTFRVGQTRSSSTVSFFEMPLPIRVSGSGGQTAYFVLDHTSNNQYFTQDVGFTVTGVTFNYENQIITKGSTVIKDNTLAVNDDSKEKINVYPNPAKSYIKVAGLEKSTDYEIFSADGKLIKKGTANPNSEINISTLVKGTYILKFNDQSVKIIKE
ncbi:T9SS type A sorting domain-containing protein [Epilithonimonas sp. JDS]|uniref:M1 family aminopeptidase n=1 Tax=Epilithonimonas sp. JDS TaxID=2902797 RepID=UPI001E39FB3F|nr:M1 family aminopeptidase [Epilithonimonas sp. JDS]MCD9853247.1 T9SS type A sorting domain-containing protein [Epilithonimonas sp. JDS]